MPRKIIWLLGSLSLLASAAWAQVPGRFDSLTTAVQVQRWVQQQPGDYELQRFQLTDSLRMDDCTGYAACAVPGGSWFKADFDGNGRTDLVVMGYEGPDNSEQQIICFLDSSRRAAHPFEVGSLGLNCAKVGMCYVGRRAALRLAHVVVPGGYYSRRARPTCRLDTLLFAGTGFIEYNRAPRDYAIRQVAFRAGPCYGTCPVFTLRVAAGGEATYQAEQFNELTGSFTATVDAATRRELWRLLNYLDFPHLDNEYAVGATEQPAVTLTITYGNSQVKTIRDYGEAGTFGLRQAYRLLFALRASQRWK